MSIRPVRFGRHLPRNASIALLFVALLGGCAPPSARPSAASGPQVPPSHMGGPRVEPSMVAPDVLFDGGSLLEVVPGAERCRRRGPVFVDILVSVVEAHPGLLVRRDGSWTVLSFDHEELSQNGWVGVSAASGCRQVAAVADCRVEAPGWALTFLLSQDYGRKFQRMGTLQKPYYMAQVSGFAMDERGRGELTLELVDDYGALVTPGIYRYATHDFGASWDGPRIEPLTSTSPPTLSSSIQLASRVDLERFSSARSNWVRWASVLR